MSCLFNSIHSLLSEEFQFSNLANLRSFMIYYIKENLNKKMNDGLTIQNWIENASIEKFNQIDVERYLHSMSNHSTWGGGPEIAILSHILKIHIFVVQNNKIISKFENCDDPFKILYINFNGSHYEPLKVVNKKN